MISFEIIEYTSIDSTNDELKRLQRSVNLHEGLCIWSPIQTDGRGQRGNVWLSKPEENLTFSFYLEPHFLMPHEAFSLLQSISLAVVDYLESRLPSSDVYIKWPNDLIVNGKKIGGILIENTFTGHDLTSIIGIGINVNQLEFSIKNATSIKKITAKYWSLRAELDHLLTFIKARYIELKLKHKVDKEYLDRLFLLNQTANFQTREGKRFNGTILGTDPQGRLRIAYNGIERAYLTGNISLIF